MHSTRLNGIYSVCRGICIRAGGCHCAAGVCRPPPQALSHGVHCPEFHVGRVSLDREGRRRKAGKREGRKGELFSEFPFQILRRSSLQGQGRGGDCRPLPGWRHTEEGGGSAQPQTVCTLRGFPEPVHHKTRQTARQTDKHSLSAALLSTNHHHQAPPHLPPPLPPLPPLPSLPHNNAFR